MPIKKETDNDFFKSNDNDSIEFFGPFDEKHCHSLEKSSAITQWVKKHAEKKQQGKPLGRGRVEGSKGRQIEGQELKTRALGALAELKQRREQRVVRFNQQRTIAEDKKAQSTLANPIKEQNIRQRPRKPTCPFGCHIAARADLQSLNNNRAPLSRRKPRKPSGCPFGCPVGRRQDLPQPMPQRALVQVDGGGDVLSNLGFQPDNTIEDGNQLFLAYPDIDPRNDPQFMSDVLLASRQTASQMSIAHQHLIEFLNFGLIREHRNSQALRRMLEDTLALLFEANETIEELEVELEDMWTLVEELETDLEEYETQAQALANLVVLLESQLEEAWEEVEILEEERDNVQELLLAALADNEQLLEQMETLENYLEDVLQVIELANNQVQELTWEVDSIDALIQGVINPEDTLSSNNSGDSGQTSSTTINTENQPLEDGTSSNWGDEHQDNDDSSDEDEQSSLISTSELSDPCNTFPDNFSCDDLSGTMNSITQCDNDTSTSPVCQPPLSSNSSDSSHDVPDSAPSVSQASSNDLLGNLNDLINEILAGIFTPNHLRNPRSVEDEQKKKDTENTRASGLLNVREINRNSNVKKDIRQLKEELNKRQARLQTLIDRAHRIKYNSHHHHPDNKN